MMEYTEIINYKGDEENKAQNNWRVRFGKVQLLCPVCGKWFTLGKEFTIDDQGHCDQQVYHFCNNESDDYEETSWTVWPQLMGWKS